MSLYVLAMCPLFFSCLALLAKVLLVVACYRNRRCSTCAIRVKELNKCFRSSYLGASEARIRTHSPIQLMLQCGKQLPRFVGLHSDVTQTVTQVIPVPATHVVSFFMSSRPPSNKKSPVSLALAGR